MSLTSAGQCSFVFDYDFGVSWLIFILHISVSPHYLVNLKTIITMRLIEPVVRNFRRKSSSVRLYSKLFLIANSFTSLLTEKRSHSHRFLINILSSNSTYRYMHYSGALIEPHFGEHGHP